MDRSKKSAVLLLLFFVLGFSADLRAQVALSPLGYYYDPQASMSLDDFIQQVELQEIYESFEHADMPLGYGDHWLFGRVEQTGKAGGDEWVMEINFPNIDRVEAFLRYDDGSTDRFLVGDEVAFNGWPSGYRKPSVPLTIPDSGGVKVYFRVNSETPLIFPITTLTKQNQESLQRKEYFLYGLFYGSIFILALYNAGVYFSLRDKSYLFYILYILSFSLVQASTTGIGQQYLWPGLDNATTRIALLAIVMTNYFMIYFVIHFLDVKSHAPGLIKPLRLLARAVLLCAPLILLPRYVFAQYCLHVLNILGMVSIIVVICRVYKRNKRPTVYLLVGYSVLFSAIMLALLFQANFIAHHSYIDFSMSAAIIFEAIVLSIGLSERIAQLRVKGEMAERARRIAQEQLSQQLIQAREYERAEISKQLHDSVNHDLVVIRKKLAQLDVDEGQKSAKYYQDIDEIESLLGSTIDDIRNISHVTHPRIVKHLGLKHSLSALMRNSFDARVIWNVHIEDVPLSEEVQLLLYRAVQEAITNILKHAQASECLVRLQVDRAGKQIRFVVKDDGQGFVASDRSWGFGLRTLNEHCKSLGGRLSVDSMPGMGVSLIITFPLTDEGQLHG